MPIAPKYSYDLISRYVEGRVNNRILLSYQHIDEFIKEFTPIIEGIHQRIVIVNKLPFEKINRPIIEDDLRESIKGAEQGLNAYNRAFGRIELYLGLITSNYNVPEFLEENGVPREQIQAFQEELRLYWAATYGVHVDKLTKMKDILDKLRKTLDQEIILMKKISKDKFFEGIENNALSIQLFEQERTLFWELVKESQTDPVLLNNLEAAVKTQIKKTRASMESAVKILGRTAKSGIQNEVDISKNNLEKSLVVLVFLSGALALGYRLNVELKKSAVKAAIFAPLRWITGRDLFESSKILCDQVVEVLNG